MGPANAKWQDEVADACRRWADKGLTSVSWDQYWSAQEKPTMQDLTRRIRDYARKVDPESSFSDESLWNVEVDCEWLDYTWNWGAYADRQAFVNAFPAPRPKVNINPSEADARFAFMDNLMLNVWPSKPDGINGSARIADAPGLSRTLKTWGKPAVKTGWQVHAYCLMPDQFAKSSWRRWPNGVETGPTGRNCTKASKRGRRRSSRRNCSGRGGGKRRWSNGARETHSRCGWPRGCERRPP